MLEEETFGEFYT
jgi:hypothetical protein